jgi:hypothetical protein
MCAWGGWGRSERYKIRDTRYKIRPRARREKDDGGRELLPSFFKRMIGNRKERGVRMGKMGKK